MKTHSKLCSSILLAAFCLTLAATVPFRAAGQDGYLALAGQNGTIEFLRLSDFATAFSINVTPMTWPQLRFLPLTRRLYVFDEFTSSLNTVLDFGTCSGGLLRPLTIPAPNFIGATGDESKLLIGSIPGAFDGVSQNVVYLVDPATDSVTGVLPGSTSTGSIGEYPRSVFDPDRNELYIWANGCKVYDNNLTLLRQCAFPVDVDSVIAAGKLYLPDCGCGGDSPATGVWDVMTGDFLRAIPYHAGHSFRAVRTRAGDKVYFPADMETDKYGNPDFLWENAVVVIDTATDQASAFPLARELNASSMVLSADETHAYIAMGLVSGGGRGRSPRPAKRRLAGVSSRCRSHLLVGAGAHRSPGISVR